jgi:hypothetical protein
MFTQIVSFFFSSSVFNKWVRALPVWDVCLRDHLSKKPTLSRLRNCANPQLRKYFDNCYPER